MKSSKSKKPEVDDISRETQRLVSDSHVHLPYHKPKQKSLKDFLNRQKISKECQVSITGSKKLLQKAWEFIENKEKTVEKFYNEDSIQDENSVELSSSNDNIQDEKNSSVNDDNIICEEDHILDNTNKNISEYSDDEENYENDSIAESELLDNNVSPMIDYSDDDEINADDENKKHKLNSNNFETHSSSSDEEDELKKSVEEDKLKKSVAKQFIDDEAEYESESSSENEENIPNFINESDEEEVEFSKVKKRKVVALSDSDDENDIVNDDGSNTDNKVLSNDLYETGMNICTQQLMGLCSGQFQTQKSEAEENEEDFEDEFDSDVPQNHASDTNDHNEMPKLTSVKDLFKNDEDNFDNSQNDDDSIDNDDFEELAKITSVKDVFHNETDDSDDPENNAEKNKIYNSEDIPKPTSAKDFFDDEAELSESDWSSDDEDHLIETIDKLEEEEGDKDKLDENIVKDGLDKIYMRQLLDDDLQQVTALKEMLLEDGDLHSDSSRKRKFQWDETDQNDAAFKKPLFSDNEDDDDEDDVLSEDEKSGNWRKERFKRESFLSQQDYDEEYDYNEEESSDILQTSVSIVKKTHVVKYQKDHGKKTSNSKSDENNELNCEIINDNEKTTSITIITDTHQINKIKMNNPSELQVTNISSKFNKIVKGSFMKHNNNNKMTNTLLYINKKLIIGNDQNKSGKCEDKDEIKSMNTITAKASSNPFAYLLRKDNKQEITNSVMSVDKKDVAYINKPVQSTSVELTQHIHQTKIRKPINSILKQLE